MEKLDVKNKKLLYHLFFDSRQSFAQLGKKVGLHRDVVARRVKKLQEKGIIKNFFTFVSCSKLGYSHVKFYLNYQNISPEIKQEIVQYLVKNPYTEAVHSLEGQYDLCIVSTVENVAKFYNIWKNIINRYRDYFSNQIFCVHNKMIEYKLPFLLDEKPNKKEDKIIYIIYSDDKKVEIDSLDKKILDLLTPNARIPTLEIAQKLRSTVTTVNSRVKKLEKTGVIQCYSINIDWSKIGYQLYKADIVMRDPTKTPQVIEYIENNENLESRIESLGYVDFELVFVLNNANQLHQIIENLYSKYPDTIKNYKYFGLTKTHKFAGVDFWNR